MLKTILTLTTLLTPMQSWASAQCAGETFGNVIVSVAINTVGTMGYVTGGDVTITSKQGQVRRYSIRQEEIPQFFESVDGQSPERAIVGMAAFVSHENPIAIRYVGTNHQEDLTKVLRTPGRRKEPGNSLRVWKGPGFASDQQHSFQDVVCSVTLDP